MTSIAFISMSFSQKHQIQAVVDRLKSVLSAHAISSKVFVDDYTFEATDEDTMMKVSCDDIAQCDFLIAELSHKAIGVGVEVGYAVGLGKPVIYMRQLNAEHSTTVSGISTYKIIYESLDDMEQQLKAIIPDLL
jgi:2'-deoxynucleoside 5'-phosphate N-hydrolase